MTNTETELVALPDTSVLFRRYLDSGRTINVYDWFESFVVAMEGERQQGSDVDEEMEIDKEKDNEDDHEEDQKDEKWRREMQARFLRSIHELEWSGLTKTTKRKRDHVARTLFDPPPVEA